MAEVLLSGRYRLVEQLGSGGMAVVWRGFDEVLGRQVAVKVPGPELALNDDFVQRLRAEARAAASLSHPHITGVHDYGEWTAPDGTVQPFVVMELVEGATLSDVLAGGRGLPWRQAAAVAAQISMALAEAHEHGIVHRDVSSCNVMLTTTGVKVLDFGISALIGEQTTEPERLLGTPAYVAPERLRCKIVSPAIDVYAVGILLYRMICGTYPWPVQNPTDLLEAHLRLDPAPLPQLPGLPKALTRLCHRCLAKEPADRPSSAELATRLAAMAGLHTLPAKLALPAHAAARPAHRQPVRAGSAHRQPVAAGAPGRQSGTAGSANRRSLASGFTGRSLAAGLAVLQALPAATGRALRGGVAQTRRPWPGADKWPAADDQAELTAAYAQAEPTAGHGTAGLAAGHGTAGPTAGHGTAGPTAGHGNAGLTAGHGDAALTGGHDNAGMAGGHEKAGAGAKRGGAGAAGGHDAAEPTGVLRRMTRPLGSGSSLAAPPHSGGMLGEPMVQPPAARRKVGMVAGLSLALIGLSAWAFGDAGVQAGNRWLEGQPTGQPVGQAAQPCHVTFQVTRDDGSRFEASITIQNGSSPQESAQLRFPWPGDQSMLEVQAASWRQTGREVVLQPSAGASNLVLAGHYETLNALPAKFTVNGTECTSTVVGAPAQQVVQVQQAATGKGPGPGKGKGPGKGEGPGKGKGGPGDDDDDD